MKIKKLTKVQKEVLARFENGEKLLSMPTDRMSGDALFWVKKYMMGNEEKWEIKEKALYPQLRYLFWANLITKENYIKPEELDFENGSNIEYLRREGALQFILRRI